MVNSATPSNKRLADVTAAILAGGLGTRLSRVVADRPKVLAEVRGRPFLAYLLDQLAAAEISRVVLCTGYLGEQVRRIFGDSYDGLRLVYSQESATLGTAGALRLALPHLESDPVLVMNGDSYCELNLNAFWRRHCAHGASATVALARMHDAGRYGQVRLDAGGVVVGFDEKRGSGSSSWINAGVYLIARSLLFTIPAIGAVSLEQELFPRWIGRGLHGFHSDGRFLDIGTPESYARAEQFFVPDTPLPYCMQANRRGEDQ